MAYVLGFWYADGSLEYAPYIRGKYIRVSSTDKSIIIKIRQALESEHTLVQQLRTPRRDSYLLRIGSHYMYNALNKQGIFPRKSLTMQFPDVPKEYLGDFFRGYFDGDGCVHIGLKRNQQNEQRPNRLLTIFTSGSKIFLEKLSETASNALKTKPVHTLQGQRSFQLRYSTLDSIILFKSMYATRTDLYLARKLNIFIRYFHLRPKKVDKEVAQILQKHNYATTVM